MGRNVSGLKGGGGPELIRTDTITASGVYTKPAEIADDDLVIVDMWGGGAGGGRGGSGSSSGFPGGWTRLRFYADELPESSAVIIGAGGFGGVSDGNPGNPGGSTYFRDIPALGGKYYGSTATEFVHDPVVNRLIDAYFQSGLNSPYMLKYPAVAIELPTGLQGVYQGGVVGGQGNSNATPARHRGGFGGISTPSGGNEVYTLGQASFLGGNGGNGQTATQLVATAGSPRGGGGGSSRNGSPAAAGGRGEVMIRYYRGVPR